MVEAVAVTIHIADIALWQGDLTPDAVYSAGFRAINVKVSHGLTQKSVHPKAREWLADTRFQRCTFHWLVGSASGADQARYAYSQIASLAECAHVVDAEETKTVVTEAIYLDYINTMHKLLGYPIITYTGDWWQASHTWLKASADSPWLMAAPNAGYLSAYPGDSANHWVAGYGGWANLDIMQYRVAPVAGIDVSQSAIRDEALWAKMRGVLVPTSQNGWPVVTASAVIDKKVLGVEFPNGWLKGDVDFIFTDLVINLNEIEKIHDGWCWGWHVKEIEGSDVISNHSSATAFDYNAPDHPVGVRNSYSKEKQAKIRALLKRYDGVIRWGGDYANRPDDMHFEIVGNKAAVAAVAKKLRSEEENEVTPEDVEKVLLSDKVTNHLANVIVRKNYTWDPGVKDPKDLDGERLDGGISDRTLATRGNGTIGMGTALTLLLDRQRVHAASDHAAAASLLSAVQSASGVPADVLAAALVGPLVSAFMAALEARGTVGSGLTRDDLRDVVADVLTGSTIIADPDKS